MGGRFFIVSEFLAVVVDVVAALETDHQAAGLCIVAAKGGGGLQRKPGVGELCQDSIPKRQCRLLAKAVGDPQLGAVVESFLWPTATRHTV